MEAAGDQSPHQVTVRTPMVTRRSPPTRTEHCVTVSILDNAVWESLTGPHTRFAQRHGSAARYHPDVSPLLGMANDTAWPDLASLAGPGAVVVVDTPGTPPPNWTVLDEMQGVQMVDAGVSASPAPGAVHLTAADVPDMQDLVTRTDPGPFRDRTVGLGTYMGLHREGKLIAMAGERLHPPGWTEISAVCTDPAFRGQGLASMLVRALILGIHSRGEQALLHASASNTTAIRLYESMGFRVRS